MSVNVSKVKVKETNNYPQGKSGAKVKLKSGPATGRGSGNPTKKGGIMKPTGGKRY